MRTVITKELAIVGNQLKATKRHVRLVGEKLSFEIEIRHFDSEPRILQQCGECVFAKLTQFVPVGCDDLKNMRSTFVECAQTQNIWQETLCLQFSPRL